MHSLASQMRTPGARGPYPVVPPRLTAALCLGTLLLLGGLVRPAFWPGLIMAAIGSQAEAQERSVSPQRAAASDLHKQDRAVVAKMPPNEDQLCAGCHQTIYASYEQTPMAQGSGPASADPPTDGSFLHGPSGIRYEVTTRDGQSTMFFDRPGDRDHLRGAGLADALPDAPSAPDPPRAAAADHNDALHGERRLRYYIGSGLHGRTYLYQVEGTWFELPINYYTARARWDMAPAFDQAKSMPANLPADPGCLHCHATGVAIALPGSRSHYPDAPFAQGGIGCRACHGDPAEHLAAHGHAPILNPGKLGARQRDSVCLSCHLEGDAVVYHAGQSLATFKPGTDLADTAIYFVRSSRVGGGGRAASQYEALLRSACKRGAGDRLTCTSCHDPHSTPSPFERVAYYRRACLACHTAPALATAHHPEQPDCAHCHMPTRATTDISHEQTTNHDIERLPAPAERSAARSGETLLPVGNWKSSDRELGLAYAQMAERGDREAGQRALGLLDRAEAAGAHDAPLEARLGFLRQMAGQAEQARIAYHRALDEDPYEPSALDNLAVLDAAAGNVSTAVALLERLIERDPTQTAAGLNLAFIECRLGQQEKARNVLTTLAAYNPDDPALRAFAGRGSYAGQHCELNASR